VPPLVPIDYDLDYGDGDEPEVTLTVRNQGAKEVDAFVVRVRLTDTFGRPVLSSGRFLCRAMRRSVGGQCNMTNVVTLTFDNGETILPGDETSGTWTLAGFDATTRVVATITAVHFTDDSTWRGQAGAPPAQTESPDTAEQACAACASSGGHCLNDASGYRCLEGPAPVEPPPALRVVPCRNVVDGNCMDP
jgi:hypothetical protein